MTEEQIQKARTIFQHYGLDNQLRILQEECAELIQAVSKYQRAQDAGKPILQAKTALMEEVADVMIMITQVICVFSGKALSTIVDSKLDRQLARIKKEYASKDKDYDIIAHHKQQITVQNVNDDSISLNPDNIMLVKIKKEGK